jgi:hypothetical protein
MGGDAADYRFCCPYNKLLAMKALENIDRLVGTLCTLVENLGVAAGVELKGSQGLSNVRHWIIGGTKCPMEGMKQEPTLGAGGGSGGGGQGGGA